MTLNERVARDDMQLLLYLSAVLYDEHFVSLAFYRSLLRRYFYFQNNACLLKGAVLAVHCFIA